MLRAVINKAAQVFKGADYQIDSDVPLNVLFGYSVRRLAGIARCFLRGVKVSTSLRDMVFIGPQVTIRNRKYIRFGAGVTLGKGVTVDGLSHEGVEFGNSVNIGQYTIIEATGVISDIGKGFSIGDNSGIGAFSFVGAAGGVRIGRDVIMGQRVSFHSENHIFGDATKLIREQGITRKGIVIKDDCWIGANVVFLDGAYVHKGCVIAAGAVVRGVIPAYSVAAGIPAKVIKSRG